MASHKKLSILLYCSIADIETAYRAGYEAAMANVDIDNNDYDSECEEFTAWETGWWDGFYNEPALYPLKSNPVAQKPEPVVHHAH